MSASHAVFGLHVVCLCMLTLTREFFIGYIISSFQKVQKVFRTTCTLSSALSPQRCLSLELMSHNDKFPFLWLLHCEILTVVCVAFLLSQIPQCQHRDTGTFKDKQEHSTWRRDTEACVHSEDKGWCISTYSQLCGIELDSIKEFRHQMNLQNALLFIDFFYYNSITKTDTCKYEALLNNKEK